MVLESIFVDYPKGGALVGKDCGDGREDLCYIEVAEDKETCYILRSLGEGDLSLKAFFSSL